MPAPAVENPRPFSLEASTAGPEHGVPMQHEYSGPLDHIGAAPTLLCLVSSAEQFRIAAAYAYPIGRSFGLEVAFGWLISVPERGVTTDPVSWFASRDALLSVARDEMAMLGADDATTVLLNGASEDMIVDWARRHPGSLLCVFAGLVHSNGLAGRLLRETENSLLFLPARPHEPSFSLLVPLDGTRRADSVVPFVHRLAAMAPEPIIFARIVTNDDPRAIARAESHLNRHCARAIQADLRARVVIGTGGAEEGLCALTRQENSGMVVLGSPGPFRTGTESPVVEYVVGHSEVPVLLLRAGFVTSPLRPGRT